MSRINSKFTTDDIRALLAAGELIDVAALLDHIDYLTVELLAHAQTTADRADYVAGEEFFHGVRDQTAEEQERLRPIFDKLVDHLKSEGLLASHKHCAAINPCPKHDPYQYGTQS